MTSPSVVQRMAPLAPGVAIGVVRANDDPLKLGRVRVSFPTLHPGPWSFWIRTTAPMAGAQCGFYALPRVGDEVLVAFLHGHHDVGIVVGQLWNGVDKPPPEAIQAAESHPEPSDRIVWRSRSGHLVLLDDTSGAEVVEIRDRTRKLSIVFDSVESELTIRNEEGDVTVAAAGDLHLKAAGSVSIEAGGDLRTKSGGATRHEVGADYELRAEGNAQLASLGKFVASSTGDTLTCKSALRTRIEGQTVEVDGTGHAVVQGAISTRLQGGVVKIN